MIKISKLADYASIILGALISAQGERMTAVSLSEETTLPEPTVAKVLKLLAKGGIVVSTRGVNGGYTLIKSPDDITVADVVAAIDGPVAVTSCIEGLDKECDYSCVCPVKGGWAQVNASVTSVLENITLRQLIGAQKS